MPKAARQAKQKRPPKPKGRPGRPSSYTQAVADEICERIALGEPLTLICADDHMPTQSMVYRWLDDEDNKEFRERYARARARQAESCFDRAYMESMTSGDAQIGRLRVDTLKWMASKLAPKKYGDKLEMEQSGGLEINVTIGGDN